MTAASVYENDRPAHYWKDNYPSICRAISAKRNQWDPQTARELALYAVQTGLTDDQVIAQFIEH